MINLEEIKQCKTLIRKQISSSFKTKHESDKSKDIFSRLCVIAGELDVLIKVIEK